MKFGESVTNGSTYVRQFGRSENEQSQEKDNHYLGYAQ